MLEIVSGLVLFTLNALAGNIPYDIAKAKIQKRFQKTPEELFADCIEEVVKNRKGGLLKYTNNGKVEFRKDVFSKLIEQGLESPASIQFTQSEDSVAQLANIFEQYQLIEIGGNQLTHDEYRILSSEIIRAGITIFKDKLQKDIGVFSKVGVETLIDLEGRVKTLENLTVPRYQSDETSDYHLPSRLLSPLVRYHFFVSSVEDEALSEREIVVKAINSLQIDTGSEINQQFNTNREQYQQIMAQSDVLIVIVSDSLGDVISETNFPRVLDQYQLASAKPKLVYVKNSAKKNSDVMSFLETLKSNQPSIYKEYSADDDLFNFLVEDIPLVLSNQRSFYQANVALSQIDYLAQLHIQTSDKNFTPRVRVIVELENILNETNVLALIGEPGIGKTFLLGELGQKPKAIYISLKNKAKLHVYAYIVNKIRAQRSAISLNFGTEIDARIQLENELQDSSAILLIDDLDSNIEIGQEIIGLISQKTKLVVAARSTLVLKDQPIRIFEVPSFTDDEIKTFLAASNLTLRQRQIQELISASNGNPLYLYYFSIEQIDPLPLNIYDYQLAIWRSMNEEKKEILALIALSIFPKTINELQQSINIVNSSQYSLMQVTERIETLKPIIHVAEHQIEIFHPLFADFISDEIEAVGLSQTFHTALGEVALKQQYVIEAAYHLSRANDKRAEQYFFVAAHLSIMAGYQQLAEEFLSKCLGINDYQKDKAMLGQIYFALANLYETTGRLNEGKDYADRAITLLNEAGQTDFANHVEGWSFAAFSELLIPDIAIERAKQIVSYFAANTNEDNEELAAATILNLSNLLIRNSRFSEGLETAKTALEMFKTLDNRVGIMSSITNISAGLAGIGDIDQQKEYAEMILDDSDDLNMPRMRMVGLNQIALYYRRKGNPASALTALEEAIRIAQFTNDPEREALNINNLGNVHFDLEDFEQAENCYAEALQLAKEHDIKREQARALELLARIRAHENKYQDVLDLSQQSINLYTQIHDEFRIASVLEHVGWSHEQLNQHFQAAESYQKVAQTYHVFNEPEDSESYYKQAAREWFIVNEFENSIECFRKRIEVRSTNAPFQSGHLNLIERYRELLRVYIELNSDESFADLILCITTLLKRHNDDLERKLVFRTVIDDLLNRYNINPQTNLLNALIVALDQADNRLLNKESYYELVSKIIGIVDGIYWRKQAKDHEIYTVGMGWKNNFIFQINSWNEELVVNKFALTLALIALANRKLLEAKANEFGGIHEIGYVIHLMKLSEFEIHILSERNTTGVTIDLPFRMTESRNPSKNVSLEDFAVLFDEYSMATDWESRPQNKALVWVLMIFFSAFVGHCTHQERDNLSREARKFAENVLN